MNLYPTLPKLLPNARIILWILLILFNIILIILIILIFFFILIFIVIVIKIAYIRLIKRSLYDLINPIKNIHLFIPARTKLIFFFSQNTPFLHSLNLLLFIIDHKRYHFLPYFLYIFQSKISLFYNPLMFFPNLRLIIFCIFVNQFMTICHIINKRTLFLNMVIILTYATLYIQTSWLPIH